MKARFMFVYTGSYVGKQPIFMQKLWLSAMFPEIANDPSFGKDAQNLRKFVQHVEKFTTAGLMKLKKVNDSADPHFVLAVPLAEFDRYDVGTFMTRMRMWFTNQKGESPDDKIAALADELKNTAEAKGMQQRLIQPQKAIDAMNVESKAKMELKDCLLGVRLQYSGGMAVVYADFKITKPEAEQLTSTEWALIRNIDLYPLMLAWQVGLWGYKGGAPVASFPMSKISKTLPPVQEGQARVNEFGISISNHGDPVWLPHKMDNTGRYEDLFSQIGDKGDDTFGLVDQYEAGEAMALGEDIKVRLPKNIPVLIDWVNNRFAYTQSNGILKIQDLSRFKTCDAAHARNLLDHWNVTSEDLGQMVDMAQTAGMPPNLFFTEEEAAEIAANDPTLAQQLTAAGGIEYKAYIGKAMSYHEAFVSEKSIRWKFISTEGDPIWRPLARFIEAASAAVLANMDAVNMKWSVHGTSFRLGQMLLIAKYANNYTDTETKANTMCAAATKAAKGPEPGWKPDSTPLIMENPDRPFSLLPHQVKVRNLLKDSPDFAILPVQAGGGKTPLAILDILMEIKANRSQPYLVMCPPPLVPQYVKELTYFTSGKVNCIPITSETLAKHGFERITKMIETAPRNSIVIANYDVLRQRAYDVCYGTTTVKIYPVIELLRQFNFGYAMMDESHNLKNDSQRTRAALMLIADIPKKRLASGTMAHDSPSDLALQIAMLDPTLFGSREEFNERFGAEFKGNRVMKWKPGAQQQIMEMIQSRIVVAKAMRKEWAALLPQSKEVMHPATLSDAQRAVYQSILETELKKIEEEAKSKPQLKKFFKNKPAMLENPQNPGGSSGVDEEADEEAEDAADESAGEDLESLLGFHLARIEQFLTAPGKDELGAAVLKGDDLFSPKVRVILDIVREHIASGIEGKVLIFTNYIESAEEIFERAGPELQKMGILYTAANKVEDGAQFETNPNKKWMVGVENSMNTGLNFQHVSRLIRVENVWNPGTLEQGNARINRPELKKADRREMIYFDWVVTDGTIDVTKVARLVSKMIAVAKFENTENDKYQNVPDMEVIPMNADEILLRNSWDSDLKEYLVAFKALNQARYDDYAEYRAKHGDLVMTEIPIAAQPKDAQIMAEVPFVAGADLFKGSEAGMIRVDEYLRQNTSDIEGEEAEDESEEGGEMSPEKRRKMELAQALLGQRIHTEFGDGVAKSVALSSKMLTVSLDSGYQAKLRFASAYVMTKPPKKKSMREIIIAAISKVMSITPPTGIMANRLKVDNKALRQKAKQEEQDKKDSMRQQREAEVEAALNIELQFNVSNGFLGIAYYPEEGADASAALQALGFRPAEEYVFAHIKTAPLLEKLFAKWQQAGFEFDKTFAKMGAHLAIADLAKVLRNGAVANKGIGYRFASRNQLVNFFRMEIKPVASDKVFKPYPMLEDGNAYIVMHTRGQPGTRKAIQVKVPGIVWQHSSPHYIYYGLSPDKIAAKMKEIQKAGIQIANLHDLQVEFKHLKQQKYRNAEVEE
jgi:hypothetical protein